jgi:pre-mRNA-processing factor 39
LFERGANAVGLDFMSHPFWDTFIEFEERQEQPERIFAILDRVIHIPMHQYARYFERYRQLAASRPVEELLPADLLSQFRFEAEPTGKANPAEAERDLRTRIDNFHLEVFHRTQTEPTTRWTFEQEIKRPYFHVTALDEAQLVNWRKYLDFEEVEGSYIRAQFLYERCLVACANHVEFWLRYVRWMSSHENKEEEVRIIYERACCVFVPISRPEIRLNWAAFEEVAGRVDVARAIFQAILLQLPGHFLTIQAWAQLERRQGGLDAAIALYKEHIGLETVNLNTKGHLVAEWARQLWKVKGSVTEAREVFQKNAHWYFGSRAFWVNYYMFERDQPTSAEIEPEVHARIRNVVDQVRKKGQLPPRTILDIVHDYMAYLHERGTLDDLKECLELDKQVDG